MAHQLRVLGSPELTDGKGKLVSLSLGKPLALLIYVACQPSPVPRDELSDLLWPEAGRQKGRHSVRQALWVLRNAIGEDLFESEDPLSLRKGALALDLHSFGEALSEGRVEDARALWGGPALDHFLLAGVRRWNQWTEELRVDLDHRFYKALLQHARSLADKGEAGRAIPALDQAIEVAPSSDLAHLARIELLLDLLLLDAARAALADAHRALGDHPDSAQRLAALEGRLDQILQERRSRVTEEESFPMEFVGRSRELAGLHALWRDADQGRTRIAVITGPSGIGKTRLARELLAYLSGDEIRSVALKGTRAEMKLRWGAASVFVRQLLRLPGSAGISPASDSLLRAMLPSMGRSSINLQTVNGVSPAAILDAVADLLEAITFEAPLVVLVDDFQWMDQDSRTLFIGLANRCRELRVLLLMLGRSDLSSRHWEDVEAALVAEAGGRRFLLAPLIEEEVGELLALGAAFPDPEEAAEVVARIHQASGGNPLFLREILKELHEKGILRWEEAGWVFRTSEVPDEFGLPENLRVLLRERLDRLSEPAANLAATLARQDKGTSSETLQRETQLPPAVFTQAVAELLGRGVIEWVDGDSLDFVHDILRDTATLHLAGSLPDRPTKAPWLSTNVGITALAMGILIALPLGIMWGRGELPWDEEPVPPPYGGGTILFQKPHSPPQGVKILKGPMEALDSVRFQPAPPSGIDYTFRGPGGGYAWFGLEDREDGPDLVRILDDGTRIPLFSGPGDQSISDLSPEGTRLLLVSENVGRETFSHSLYWAGLEQPDSLHLVYEGSSSLGLGQWSQDGDRVAFIIAGAPDSLAVYSLTGERLWARAFGEIHGLDWCGESILLAAAPEEQLYLFKIDLPEGEVTPITPLALGRGMACSPDGTAVVLIDVFNRRPAFILRDLVTGEVHPFPSREVNDFIPLWIPDAVSRVPVGVTALGDTIRMGWGERLTVAASLVFRDGSEPSEEIWWESLDPNVANFNAEEELTGNEVGVTQVLARWGHSLQDTVVVVVEDRGAGNPSALWRERWETIDTAEWIPFGSHPPAVKPIDGEYALQIRGDEKYADGVMFKRAIPLDQGITIELDLKMNLTRNVHQNLNLCLFDTDPSRFDGESGLYPESGEVLCLLYPSRDLDKMDPSEVSLLITPGVETRVRLPDALPTSDWTHLALQVRADGECGLVVNRERVATSPITLPIVPKHQWTIILEGDAVGTEVLVRNLNVWREIRY